MPRRTHLATRQGPACGNSNITAESLTTVHSWVTCVPCRNSSHYVDAVARHLNRFRNGTRKARR